MAPISRLNNVEVASGAVTRSGAVPVDARQAQRVSNGTTADLADTTSAIGWRSPKAG